MSRTALSALSVSFLLLACGGSAAKHEPIAPAAPGAETATSATPAASLKLPGEAKLGERTKCPVSGEEFVVAADSPKTDYEGKTYYFCCASCVDSFKADPKKYAAK